MLDKANIPEVEVGTPAIGAQEIDDIKTIVDSGFNFKTLAWCRACKADIDAAVKSGTQGVNISFPVSDIHLNAMGRDRQWVIDTMHEVVRYASSNFEYIAIGAQDASRADISFLIEFISEAILFKITRVRIADTVGILNPITTSDLFLIIKNIFPDVTFEFHAHNDLGMATANTLMALSTGAECCSVTVNGIGERAGNAALEEVVMALELSSSLHHNVQTSVFGELSQYVSKATGIQIPVNKPVVGSKSLSHESGIHTNILLKDRETYQIIKASHLGLKEQDFVFGKHSGKASLIAFLEQNNIKFQNNEYYNDILTKIKHSSNKLKRSLTRIEVLSFIKEII